MQLEPDCQSVPLHRAVPARSGVGDGTGWGGTGWSGMGWDGMGQDNRAFSISNLA